MDGTERGRKVSDLIDENDEVFTCALTVAEVISKAARKGKDTKAIYDILTSNSEVIVADEDLSFEAGLQHSEMRKTIKDFGLTDAYVLATAKKLNAKILTGDKHFKGIKEAVLI